MESFSCKTVCHYFEKTAALFPNHIALVSQGESITYEQLNRRTDQLAFHLKSIGVVPETLVGLYLKRSPEAIIALLAILKAGGAYLPLDCKEPVSATASKLEQGQVNFLIAFSAHDLPENEFRSYKTIFLDEFEKERDKSSIQQFSIVPKQSDLAYVIYTSGSTGRPKGVEIEHNGLLNLALSQIDAFSIHSESSILQYSELYFDASVSEIFTALLSGAALYFIHEEARLDPIQFQQYLQENKISVATIPPALLARIDKPVAPFLETLVVAGEVCSQAIIDAWASVTHVINAYGPTEASVCATLSHYDGCAHNNIGRPIPQTQCYVLDDSQEKVSPGQSGELCLSGIGLARGYRNDSALTQQKFIQWKDKDTGQVVRLYRTGDQVKLLQNGALEYVGRLDFEIKFNGVRINPAEIEDKILEHPAVQQSIVLLSQSGNRNKLVAYNILKASESLEASDLRKYLERYFPQSKIPNVYLFLDQFPLSKTGKVDRNALSKISFFEEKVSDVSPLSEKEKALRVLWSKVLKIDEKFIGSTSDFFALGGSSLNVAELSAMISEERAVNIKFSDIFEQSTLSKMSKRIDELSTVLDLPVKQAKNNDSFPTSFSQDGIWLAHQSLEEQDKGAYNLRFSILFEGSLNIAALKKAFHHLVKRHEIFQACFPKAGFQKFSECEIPFVCYDLSDKKLDPHDDEVKATLKGLLGEHFSDLSSGPLVRPALITLSKNQFIFSVVMHHILIDGLSLPTLSKELSSLYNASLNNEASHLPELSFNYRDFSVWQKKTLEGRSFDRTFAYWESQLEGVSGLLHFPLKKKPKDKIRREAGSRNLYFPKSLSDKLKNIAKQERVSLFSLLFCSISTLLYRYTGQDDFVMGAVCGERPHPVFDSLVGCFINVLPIRVQHNDSLSFTDVLSVVGKDLQKAYQHNVPLSEIVRRINLPRHPNVHPLFQVTVVMHDLPSLEMNFSNLKSQCWDESVIESSNSMVAKFDLEFEMEMLSDGRLAAKLAYPKALFDEASIDTLLECWGALAEDIANRPEKQVASLALLPENEKQKLIKKWSLTEPHYSRKTTILEAFNEQVRSRPEAIAIVDGDFSISYGDLNQKTNRLANYLLSQQDVSKSENIIGVALGGSADFIISILSILKANSAYLPLDPNLPLKRIEFMLSDANVSMVLTSVAYTEKLSKADVRCIAIDDERQLAEISECSEARPNHLPSPHSLAYVIYTSGSTGQPKGVMVEHHSVVSLAKNLSYLDLGHEDVVAQVCNLTFDVSGFEIWGGLLNGSKIVVYSKATLLDLAEFRATLIQEKITVLVLPTILFYRIALLEPRLFSTLKSVLFIGEKLMKTDVVQNLIDNPSLAPKNLINVYGPTEDTIFSTVYTFHENEQVGDEIPIGRPIEGTTTYILDAQRQPVPPGFLGELYLGGVGLARGYLNREDLTEKAFISSPFSKKEERLYRTGDLVYYAENGDITLVKRLDKQVKVLGYRVEIGEIERIILSQSNVSEAVVLQESDENKRLIAYVSLVKKQDTLSLEGSLRAALAEALPYYMIPSAFVFLDKFPLSLNGKLDRKKLPKPSFLEKQDKHVLPETETEEKIMSIWKSILNLDSSATICIEADFFSVGGNSLLSMALSNLINKEFGEIAYSSLFSNPCIRDQAQLLDLPENQRKKTLLTSDYLEKEAELNLDITSPVKLPVFDLKKEGCIFLTGVTGFLGIFLLDELLRNTDANIYCLVRARDEKHARERIEEVQLKYKVNISPALKARVFALAGDLEQENFGLPPADYKLLSEKVDLIYHSASVVSFIKPYLSLRESNVTGTRNILHFASIGKVKHLHYISTAAAFSFTHYFTKNTSLLEEKPVEWTSEHLKALSNDLGYTQSKAIAERLVWEAKEAGLPVAIHRVGFILCHSQTGLGGVDQLWGLFVKDCLALGSYPDLVDFKAEFVTVDYASRAIVRISQQASSMGKIFHIVPGADENLSIVEFFQQISSFCPLKKEPFREWRSRLQDYISSNDDSALKLLFPLLSDIVQDNLSLFELYQDSPHFSISNTKAFLEEGDFANFEINSDIIKNYLRHIEAIALPM